MALMSPSIPVADATSWTAAFPQPVQGANITIVFYSTSAALEGDAIAVGTGSRNVTVTYEAIGRANTPSVTSPDTVDQRLELGYEGGTAVTVNARKMRGFSFGAKSARSCTVSAVANVNPGGATHYRIWIEG